MLDRVEDSGIEPDGWASKGTYRQTCVPHVEGSATPDPRWIELARQSHSV